MGHQSDDRALGIGARNLQLGRGRKESAECLNMIGGFEEEAGNALYDIQLVHSNERHVKNVIRLEKGAYESRTFLA